LRRVAAQPAATAAAPPTASAPASSPSSFCPAWPPVPAVTAVGVPVGVAVGGKVSVPLGGGDVVSVALLLGDVEGLSDGDMLVVGEVPYVELLAEGEPLLVDGDVWASAGAAVPRPRTAVAAVAARARRQTHADTFMRAPVERWVSGRDRPSPSRT
jgi:hypothetical protein